MFYFTVVLDKKICGTDVYIAKNEVKTVKIDNTTADCRVNVILSDALLRCKYHPICIQPQEQAVFNKFISQHYAVVSFSFALKQKMGQMGGQEHVVVS